MRGGHIGKRAGGANGGAVCSFGTRLEGTCAQRSRQVCKGLRIDRHPAVIGDDVPVIYAYIACENPEATERVLNAVEETFAQITAQPESGALYPTRNPKMKPYECCR